MLRLQDIMTRDIVTLSPEHSIREAMSILTSRHISGAPVLSNSKVVGVVSLTDLAELAASAPAAPGPRARETDWSEWDEPVNLAEGDEPPGAYFQRLWEDSGADVTERMEEPDSPEWNVLEEHTVGEAMTRDVRSLHPGTSVEDAAQFMRNASIHRVLVMENRELLGVVSTRDIANAVADHKLTNRTFVFGAPRYL
jgi:CBS domain-containing protein